MSCCLNKLCFDDRHVTDSDSLERTINTGKYVSHTWDEKNLKEFFNMVQFLKFMKHPALETNFAFSLAFGSKAGLKLFYPEREKFDFQKCDIKVLIYAIVNCLLYMHKNGYSDDKIIHIDNDNQIENVYTLEEGDKYYPIIQLLPPNVYRSRRFSTTRRRIDNYDFSKSYSAILENFHSFLNAIPEEQRLKLTFLNDEKFNKDNLEDYLKALETDNNVKYYKPMIEKCSQIEVDKPFIEYVLDFIGDDDKPTKDYVKYEKIKEFKSNTINPQNFAILSLIYHYNLWGPPNPYREISNFNKAYVLEEQVDYDDFKLALYNEHKYKETSDYRYFYEAVRYYRKCLKENNEYSSFIKYRLAKLDGNNMVLLKEAADDGNPYAIYSYAKRIYEYNIEDALEYAKIAAKSMYEGKILACQIQVNTLIYLQTQEEYDKLKALVSEMFEPEDPNGKEFMRRANIIISLNSQTQ